MKTRDEREHEARHDAMRQEFGSAVLASFEAQKVGRRVTFGATERPDAPAAPGRMSDDLQRTMGEALLGAVGDARSRRAAQMDRLMGREPEAGDSAGGSSEVDYMAVLAVMSDPDARHKQRMRWVDEGRITIAQAADDLRATEAAEQSASHTADLDAAGGAGAAAQPSGIAGARWASAAELDDEDED